MVAPSSSADNADHSNMQHANKPSTPPSLSDPEIQFITDKLSDTPMFRYCNQDDLVGLARGMHKVKYNHNDFLVNQNDPAENLLVLSGGEARRTRLGRDGVERHLYDTTTTVNSLTITSGDPIYAAAKCISESCTAYAINREEFRKQLSTKPRFATDIIQSLSEEVRTRTIRFRTPFLSQKTKNDVNYPAVAVAATVESYYRSALNAILNRQLTGNSTIPLFPSMHVQVPARIAYITGFKSLRSFFDNNIDPDLCQSRAQNNAVRLATALSPGIFMTPVASLLEACNVGHVNPEPLLRRCMRGVMPRAGREIIFGVGLNQLSDYFEERYRTLKINPVLANSLGSVTAGVAAGYFSHVPHNVSTLRMLHPHQSYRQIFQTLVQKSPAPSFLIKRTPQRFTTFVRSAWACFAPKGVLTRTVQICGSFTILNGIILLIEGDNRRRMRKAMESNEPNDNEVKQR